MWVWIVIIVLILIVAAIAISPSSQSAHKPVQSIPPVNSPVATSDPYTDSDFFVAAWREAGTKQEIMAKCIASVKIHPDWLGLISGRKNMFSLETRELASGKYDQLFPYVNMESKPAKEMFIQAIGDDQVQRVEAMLKLKMNPNTIGLETTLKQTGFFTARSRAMIDLLVKFGGDVNLPQFDGQTPYQRQKAVASLEVLEALKSHGAH